MTDSNEAKYYTDQGKIICQECYQAYQVIGSTHLKKHNLTMTTYKEKYPGIPVSSKSFKAKSKYKHLDLEGFGKANKANEFKKAPAIPDHNEIRKQAEQKENPKKSKKPKVKLPPILQSKPDIIEFLKTIYSSVKENHFIQNQNLSGLKC